MLPVGLQEHVFTNIKKTDSYRDMADQIREFVSNKVSMNPGGGVPMDVGNVAQGQEGGWEDEVDDVNAVGFQGQYRNCQGWGHFARECPTKGKGKGPSGLSSKGYGKNGGKGGVPSYGGKASGKGVNGGKAAGGGYQGRCYNCNEVGHKKWECTKPRPMNSVDEQEGFATVHTVSLDGVWMIGCVDIEDQFKVVRGHGGLKEKIATKNRLEALEDEDTMIMHVEEETGGRLTRASAMRFNEADVRKPLASAALVARAGNRIVMEENGGYIENKATGERMKMRVEQNAYVYDVQLEDGSTTTVTMDSGAGCCVWPRGKHAGKSILTPKQPGIKMVAANGTEIGCYGQRVVQFRGIEAEREAEKDFPRRT